MKKAINSEELLNVLPIHYYVIDSKKKIVVQSNDPLIKVGESCHKQLFNKKEPCMQEDYTCLCRPPYKKTSQSFTSVIEKNRNNNKEYYRAEIKSIAENIILATFTNITGKIKDREELNKANVMLRTLIDNIPDAIYMKDNQYRKIIANKGDARNCGVDNVEEIIGKTDYDLYPKETAELYINDDKHVIEEGKSIINREEELPVTTPKRLNLTTKLPLKNDQHEVIGLVGIGRDITRIKKITQELQKAKEKAEESDRLKSLFLANMSHEIRTPLNAILGFSNIICSSDADEKEMENYRKIIENSGIRLMSVINDIIDVSLIQSNQLKMEYNFFDINDLIKELHASYKNQKTEKLSKIEFKAELCENPEHCTIQSDKNRIYQILKNLLDNAFKFTEEGFIEFGCSTSDEDELVLYVEDSGIGINQEKTGIIFKSFRQVEEGISRKYEGSGLGLAIITGITEQLGGKIWVRSELGQGSSFYVLLPRHKTTSEMKREKAKLIPPKKKKTPPSKRIVSFEDDPASIEYLKNVVSLLGYELINFVQPDKGIDFLKNNKADLVLMDIQLPEMNGYEATRIIKSEYPHMPVIIQTAYAMKGDMEKAFQAGCDDYMTKPISLNTLKYKIAHFIENE